jgi:hypothetical protein
LRCGGRLSTLRGASLTSPSVTLRVPPPPGGGGSVRAHPKRSSPTTTILPRQGEVAPKATEGEDGGALDRAQPPPKNPTPPVAFPLTLPYAPAFGLNINQQEP